MMGPICALSPYEGFRLDVASTRWSSSCVSGDKTETLSVDQQIAYGTEMGPSI
jgi:hypothetical protein